MTTEVERIVRRGGLSEKDLNALATNLIGDANDLISAVLVKHAKGVILGARDIYDELKHMQKQRDDARHCIDTLITNLKAGANVDDVLSWYDSDGQLMVRRNDT